MAGSPTVLNVWRNRIPVMAAGGESTSVTDDDALSVLVDRYGGPLENSVLRLLFATYAGLEAEFEAGAATTVLDAAMTTELAGSPRWGEDSKTSAQRGYLFTEYP